jgi:hypothetical protein
MPEAESAEPGELDEELFAEVLEGESGLEIRPLGAARPLLGDPETLAGRGGIPLGHPKPVAVGRILGEQGLEIDARRVGAHGCRRELRPRPLDLRDQLLFAIGEPGLIPLGRLDRPRVEGDRGVCRRAPPVGLAPDGIDLGGLRGEPVASLAQGVRTLLPRADRGLTVVVPVAPRRGAAGRGNRARLGGRRRL